ncbi:MAG: hypothetical protein U0270_13310 [Labilithrix sp.]
MTFLRVEIFALTVGLFGIGATGYGLGRSHQPAPPPLVPPVVLTSFSTEPDCARLGVHFTVDGHDAFAPAVGERDRAGHKYRRGGDRSTWLHVMGSGPITVHASGDFMASDTGRSEHPWLSISVKGEGGSWELARDGRAMMEVTGSDEELVRGRFEADMSHTPDGRTPAFGSPVTRVRGTFCLRAVPSNPSDTAP